MVFHANQAFFNKKCGVNALMRLPNEVIISILQKLSIPDLLLTCQLQNIRFHTLAKKVLVQKLVKTKDCHLRLCFDQENHWRFTVDFKFTKATQTRLAFTPVKPVSVRMYNSKLLRRPILHKASLVGPDFVVENPYLVHNLIRSPLSLDIKETGLHQHHYAQGAFLAYQITKTPENMVKARAGERWVEPLGFECSFDFLSQTKKMMQRVFDTLHNKPVRRQIDGVSFTASARLPQTSKSYAVAEIGGLWQKKFHYGTSDKNTNNTLLPILGGLIAQ
ncbi:hypothetical protein INT47_008691 [Mucor saturninus]|uniref:F-box domain-containing protein n=1 Tax=Mucor saturninus TaxID=64648 RepID=A0A8H7V8Y1_9FUNG|nr:hypothetical protein INT47_008691 [Mucor saturninus]